MFDEIYPDDVSAWLEEGAQIVDVREVWEFGAGHVPGAVNIPLDELISRVDELREPLVLVCATGNRSGMAAQYLTTRAGFDRVANLVGGTYLWVSQGKPTEKPGEHAGQPAQGRRT
jgi:rhodanese-related sulfurtransferase